MSLVRKRGFTLVEIVVVMAIIAVLALLVVGAITIVREQARITQGRSLAHSIESSMKDSTLASWHFDENSGTTAKDDWNNKNLTFLSSNWVQGINNIAYYFSVGTGRTFSAPNTLGQLGTVSFWFRLPTTADMSGTLFAAAKSTTGGDTCDDIGLINGVLQDRMCAPAVTITDSSFVVADTNWHQVVLSRSANNTQQLCLDGKCKSFTQTMPLYDASYLTFDGGTGCGQGSFNDSGGQGVIIDELSIYSKAF